MSTLEAALGTEGCPEEVPLETSRLSAYGLKCELFGLLFSEFLAVLLMSMDPHSPVSESFFLILSMLLLLKEIPKVVCLSRCE